MSVEYLDYPLGIGRDGKVATTDEDNHIHDLIEQVLFTNPGERVNLPEFGCGLKHLVFAPNSDILATTTQFIVSGALQKWLGHLINVEAVQVKAEYEKLFVTIKYTKLRSREEEQVRFARRLP